jgi:hypothetical protein
MVVFVWFIKLWMACKQGQSRRRRGTSRSQLLRLKVLLRNALCPHCFAVRASNVLAYQHMVMWAVTMQQPSLPVLYPGIVCRHSQGVSPPVCDPLTELEGARSVTLLVYGGKMKLEMTMS